MIPVLKHCFSPASYDYKYVAIHSVTDVESRSTIKDLRLPQLVDVY